MIRMYINNEEVVCDKELTIAEEFLATSSITLKNCYPKSWELTKDYVNNFYFPPDYAKCLIYDSKEVSFTIEGSLEQNGNPTPDNPIPIITKTGNITINVDNKDYNIDLGNMELCKIGNNTDYIYKNGDTWYKHTAIGKKILDGTENGWSKNNYTFTNNQLFTGRPSSVCSHFTNSGTSWVSRDEQYRGKYTTTNSNNEFKCMPLVDSSIDDFKTWLSNNNVTLYYVLSSATEEEITDTNLINQLNNVGNDLLFCGVVKNTGNIDLNPRQPHYCSLQVLDFKTFLSEGETLDFVISNKTVSEAIGMVVNAISQYGFVVGNIELASASDMIGAYSTLNKTAYDVFQYLADITQSRWFTRLVDDNTVAIDFYDPESLPQAEDLEYSQEYYEENNIIDIKYNYSTKDYRNKQIMLSDEVLANIDYNDTLIADGYNTTFSLLYNIGNLKSVSVNGVAKTIGTSEEKEQGYYADFYFTLGSNTIESDSLYPVGDEIAIVYTPLVKGRQIISNDDEIDRIASQTGRSGTITRYETRNDAITSDELQKIGESYIKYKGKPEIILTVKTYNNDLYNIGQTVEFVNAPLEALELDYMIKKKTTQIIATTGDIFYTYELSSSYNSESEINYFDNQRLKAQGNLSKDEFITRNIDIENSVSIIFDNLSITEITVQEGNVLDATLDAPFNS